MNDGAFGWVRCQINGNLGPCCGNPTLAGRAFAQVTELENPAGRIIAESIFINERDQAFGDSGNSASWTEWLMPDLRPPSGSGTTAIGEPTIFAW